MAFSLYVGAARAAATREQASALRQGLLPLLDGYRASGDVQPIKSAVRAVLGEGWEPTGEWAAWIRKANGGDLL